MATLEERLASLEHDQAELKQKNVDLKEKIDLLTVSVGALVNKATLEQLKEQNEKIFEALQGHDTLINMQLSEMRETETGLDGKIVGLQTEMRQSFKNVDAHFETMATKDDLKAMATKDDLKAMATKDDLKAMATKDDLSAMNARFDAVDARFDQIMLMLSTLTNKPEQET